jgi:uncharacterized protein with LGFP repeats
MFNIEEVFKGMTGAVQNTVTTAWPQVQGILQQFLQTNKDLLQQVADGRISGDLTNADVESYMVDLKNTLTTQLLALEIMGEAIAQQAANAALDIFWAAVNKVVGGLI